MSKSLNNFKKDKKLESYENNISNTIKQAFIVEKGGKLAVSLFVFITLIFNTAMNVMMLKYNGIAWFIALLFGFNYTYDSLPFFRKIEHGNNRLMVNTLFQIIAFMSLLIEYYG